MKEGKMNGFGILTGHMDGSGRSYEGVWKDNKIQKGIYKSSAYGRYEGDFLNNQRHGVGTQKYPSGRIYKGKFRFGNVHGRGVMTYDGVKLEEHLGRWGRIIGGKIKDG